MTFEELLDQAIAMLRRRGRVTYRALKRQFDLDDDYLEDLKAELIEAQHVAIDEGGTVLVWTGAPTRGAEPTSEPTPAPRSYTPAHLAETILTSKSALEGERKQVTVLFADLKGSMELLADRDPEDARAILDPVLERMMAAVHRYEGTVNQVMGDGIMALFGAPLAHEDHAVRACYAALAMQETIGRYAAELRRQQGLDVQIRVGLNSGEVVVRSIGNDLHMDYTAVGQTTHLAARMEQLARPGTTLLTADTWRLVEGYIEVNSLGPVPVKGVPEPLEIYELLGAGQVRSRLQAVVARGLTRFVGRDTELDQLRQARERAGAGQGQVVAVIGEAGVGKSRLFYEFTHSHRTHGWLLLASTAVSYGKATPYLPVIDLLKAYFGIEPHDDARTRREKVTGKLLTLDRTLEPALPAMLALLEVPVEDPQWQALDPPQRRQRTLDAVKRVLRRESQVQPLLLIFEDLHWIDTETQALLDALVESLPAARMFLLVNYRPEYQHGWGQKTYYIQLRLDPLPPQSAEALLEALLGAEASLMPLKRLLIERTQGNPFFLEETVHTLMETQALVGEPGTYHLAQTLPSIQVPATVHAVLAARIDRLTPEYKRLLQTAAVIGHEAPLTLVQAIAELPETDLHRGLARLQALEFLYETQLFPELAYAFKHALTHEVAYGSLLQERRRAVHAQIVGALEALAGDRIAEQVERLAHHAFRGEVWAKAVTYCRQAGTKAAVRSAYREAVACFEQALVALQHLPESRNRLEQAIDLRLELRSVLHPLGDVERMLEVMCQATTLAETLNDQRRLGWTSSRTALACWQVGDLCHAIEFGQRAHAIGLALPDATLQATANWCLGVAYQALGAYTEGIDCLTRNAVVLEGDLSCESNDMRVTSPLAVTSLAVTSRAQLARCLAEIGAFAEGIAYGEAAVQLAETLNRPYDLVSASLGIGHLYLRKGDYDRAIRVLERGLDVCRAWDVWLLFPWVASALGGAYALSDRVTDGLSLLEQAVGQAASMRFMVLQASRLAMLSEATLIAGHSAKALAFATQALTLARDHQERGTQAWALRLLGQVASHRDPPEVEQAKAYYLQAMALAEELGMRPLQAHCHMGLGALYARTGQREQAHAELSVAIERYHAMEMTFWLARAEAALAEVEGY